MGISQNNYLHYKTGSFAIRNPNKKARYCEVDERSSGVAQAGSASRFGAGGSPRLKRGLPDTTKGVMSSAVSLFLCPLLQNLGSFFALAFNNLCAKQAGIKSNNSPMYEFFRGIWPAQPLVT
jgi:hypothetical protein